MSEPKIPLVPAPFSWKVLDLVAPVSVRELMEVQFHAQIRLIDDLASNFEGMMLHPGDDELLQEAFKGHRARLERLLREDLK